VGALLRDAVRLCEALDSEGVSVLVHDSTGWGRSTQLSSLTQLMLDPYYRTLDGFCILIEKEWFSFGHVFTTIYDKGDDTILGPRSGPSTLFVQWLDAVWQLLQQFPLAFEFDELLLVELIEQCSSAQTGSFLFATEAERVIAKAHNSIWALVLDRRSAYINPFYSLASFFSTSTKIPQTLSGERSSVSSAVLRRAPTTSPSSLGSTASSSAELSAMSTGEPDSAVSASNRSSEESFAFTRLSPACSVQSLQFWASGHLRAERSNAVYMHARDQLSSVLRGHLQHISPLLKLAEEATFNQVKLQNLQQAHRCFHFAQIPDSSSLKKINIIYCIISNIYYYL
jgi:hypothetical protein